MVSVAILSKDTNLCIMNQIKLVILDIDGVLTDGTKLYDSKGKVAYKSYNDKDFTAIKRLKASGVSVCFLTGDLNVNEVMAKKRGIDLYYSRTKDGSLNKSSFLPMLYEKYQSDRNSTVYVGDDLFDLDIIMELSRNNCYCPSDAISDVVSHCYSKLSVPGGCGVVAELYEELVYTGKIKGASLETVVELDRIESMTALKK